MISSDNFTFPNVLLWYAGSYARMQCKVHE